MILAVACKRTDTSQVLDAGGGGDACNVAGQQLAEGPCRGYEAIRGKRQAGTNGWDWDVSNTQLANPQAFDWRGLIRVYASQGGGSMSADYTQVSEADRARVWSWFNDRYGFISDSGYDPSNTPFGITVNTSQNLGRQQSPSAQNPWFHMNCLTCHLGEAKDGTGKTVAWMGIPNYKIKWPLLWQELKGFNDLPDLANPQALLRRAQAKFDAAVRDIVGTPPTSVADLARYTTRIPGILQRLGAHLSAARGMRISDLFARGEALEDFFAKYVFSLYFKDKNWVPGQSPAAFIGFFGLKSKDLSPNGSFDANYPAMFNDFFPNRGSLIRLGSRDFTFRNRRLFSIPYISSIDPAALAPVLAYKEYVIPDNVMPWAWSKITPGHFTEQIFIKRRNPDVRPLLNGSFYFTEPKGANLTSQTFVDRMTAIQTLVDAVALPPASLSADDIDKGAAGEQVFKDNCGRCHNALTIDPANVQPGVGQAPYKNFKDVGTNPDLSIMYQVSAAITGSIPYFTGKGFRDVVRLPDAKDKGRYRAQPLIEPAIRQRVFHDASVAFDDLISGTYQGPGHTYVASLAEGDRAMVAAYLKVRCVLTPSTDAADGTFGVLNGPDYASNCVANTPRAPAAGGTGTATPTSGDTASLLDDAVDGSPPTDAPTGTATDANANPGSGPQPDDTAGGDGPNELGPDPAPDDGTEDFDTWFTDFCAQEGVTGCDNVDAGLQTAEANGTGTDTGADTGPGN